MDMAYGILQTLLQTFSDSIKKNSALRHLSPFLWKTCCIPSFRLLPSDLVSLPTCVINIHPNTHTLSSVPYVQPITRYWVGGCVQSPALGTPPSLTNAAEFIPARVSSWKTSAMGCDQEQGPCLGTVTYGCRDTP